MLKHSDAPLWERYDLAMLDLDGVVYIGPHAVPGAAERLAAAAAAGMHLAYVTNNASRPPGVVAAHLQELGIPAEASDVVTSAQAAARLLAEKLSPGDRVFVIGGQGLLEALDERGLVGVQEAGDETEPRAVVSGYNADLTWRTVTTGAILVKSGLLWVASNTDLSVPTPEGHGPGNGVLVDAVARFAGREPLVAGKPQSPLFEETQLRVGGERPLVVGDRLDTDIEGAHNAGLDSLLVLTGVTGLEELVTAPQNLRPTYIASGLDGLGVPHPAPEEDRGSHRLGGWTVRAAAGDLSVEGRGAVDDWWRVVAAAAWSHLDTTGEPVRVAGLPRPPR
jgi:HAD superfamily hydrolase (TIGR01450 family)